MTIAPRPSPSPSGGPESGRGGRIALMVGLIVLLLALVVAAVFLARSSFSGSGESAPANVASPTAPAGSDPTRDEDRAAAERARAEREEAPEEGVEEEPPPAEPLPAPTPGFVPARLVSGSISDADYPAAAIRAEQQGTTSMTIAVGTNGRVTLCSVASSSGSAVLDTTSCSLVQRRFRFEPATQNGRPVPSTVTRRITWRLPEY